MVAERSLAATHGRAKQPTERSNGRMSRRTSRRTGRDGERSGGQERRLSNARESNFVDQLSPRRPSLAYHRLAHGDDTLVEDFSEIDDPMHARANVLRLATCRTRTSFPA
jgi:hypothetical protein